MTTVTIKNLISATFQVHAPSPVRPDYFLCQPRGRFGAPNAMETDSPVGCANCLRHPVTRYRKLSTEELRKALQIIRNETRRINVAAVLRERGEG